MDMYKCVYKVEICVDIAALSIEGGGYLTRTKRKFISDLEPEQSYKDSIWWWMNQYVGWLMEEGKAKCLTGN